MIDNYKERDTKIAELKIANCRGKKPVIKDITKAREILRSLMVELNPCEGKDLLKDAEYNLTKILAHNV